MLLTFFSEEKKIFSRKRVHTFFFLTRESLREDIHVQQRDDDADDDSANVLQRAKSVDKQRGVGVLATPVRFTFDSDRTSRGKRRREREASRSFFFFSPRRMTLPVRYFPINIASDAIIIYTYIVLLLTRCCFCCTYLFYRTGMFGIAALGR